MSAMNLPVTQLSAQTITPERFRPYGQVIRASAEGKGFDAEEAQLELSQGMPRFYIMRLQHRGRRFDQITRHRRCTQCLGSLHGATWLMAVAPPSKSETPSLESITAFEIPGDCFIKLAVGTWHAGPYFEQVSLDFYNLELSDTNLADHQTCSLQASYGITFEILACG